jgi:hypothetical protein
MSLARCSIKLISTVLLLATAILGSAGDIHAQVCPHVCPAIPTDDGGVGTLPAGTQIYVTANPPTPGTSDTPCQTTCTLCTQLYTVSFYGNGTGNCIAVNHDGGGWSTPAGDNPPFSRPGWHKAKCGSSDTLEIRGGGCAGLPNTYAYTRTLVLHCNC